MIQKRKQYPKQFKVDAVKLVTEQGYKVSEAAWNLGIHHSSLRRWKKQFETNGNQAFPGKGDLSLEKEELYRLRKENKRFRIEREILKKPRPSLRKNELSALRADFFDRIDRIYMIFLFSLYPEHPVYPV